MNLRDKCRKFYRYCRSRPSRQKILLLCFLGTLAYLILQSYDSDYVESRELRNGNYHGQGEALHGEPWIYAHHNDSKCKPISTHLLVPEVDNNDCSLPYVIMHHKGMLGNNMCQFLSIYVLRMTFGVRVCATKQLVSVMNRIFQNISYPIGDTECFNQKMKYINYPVLYNKLLTKASDFAKQDDETSRPSLLDATYRFSNSPCTRMITAPFRDLARKIMTFKDEIIESAKTSIEESLRSINRTRDDSTLITVHARRGDYVPYMKHTFKLTVVTPTYFVRAFAYYRKREKNPVFLVISDDPTWCRENIQGSDVVVGGMRRRPEVDIAILSLGDHHVIVYGTYGYMGALLGHGTITYPVDKKNLYGHYNCNDPKIFIPISRDEDEE